jgi:hypothetical protein
MRVKALRLAIRFFRLREPPGVLLETPRRDFAPAWCKDVSAETCTPLINPTRVLQPHVFISDVKCDGIMTAEAVSLIPWGPRRLLR